MTHQEAAELDADLRDLKALRENRVWKNHILPEIERMRTEARTGMRDRTKPAPERCEHVTAHEQAELLREFLEKLDARLRAQLKAHDDGSAIIERPWG